MQFLRLRSNELVLRIADSPCNRHVLVRDAVGDERWVDRSEIRGRVAEPPTDWWAA